MSLAADSCSPCPSASCRACDRYVTVEGEAVLERFGTNEQIRMPVAIGETSLCLAARRGAAAVEARPSIGSRGALFPLPEVTWAPTQLGTFTSGAKAWRPATVSHMRNGLGS